MARHPRRSGSLNHPDGPITIKRTTVSKRAGGGGQRQESESTLGTRYASIRPRPRRTRDVEEAERTTAITEYLIRVRYDDVTKTVDGETDHFEQGSNVWDIAGTGEDVDGRHMELEFVCTVRTIA